MRSFLKGKNTRKNSYKRNDSKILSASKIKNYEQEAINRLKKRSKTRTSKSPQISMTRQTRKNIERKNIENALNLRLIRLERQLTNREKKKLLELLQKSMPSAPTHNINISKNSGKRNGKTKKKN